MMSDQVSLMLCSIPRCQVHLESPDTNPGVRLSLADWLQALLRISAKLYSDCDPQEAFDKVG